MESTLTTAAGSGLPTFWLMLATAAVVLSLLALTIRVDPAGRLRRLRHEQHVRRGTAALLAEAERAQREHLG